MFDTLTHSKEDAIVLLKQDHDTVKELFEKFEKAESLSQKKKIAAQAIEELKLHAEVEETIYYPAVRTEVGKDIMNEADEEHHVAKLLIAELEKMDGSESHWEAKFIVLAENVRHHIKEEEADMMPKSRKADVDFEAIGREMIAMKAVMKKEGIPVSDEAKLMAHRKTVADSPARNAKKKHAA